MLMWLTLSRDDMGNSAHGTTASRSIMFPERSLCYVTGYTSCISAEKMCRKRDFHIALSELYLPAKLPAAPVGQTISTISSQLGHA